MDIPGLGWRVEFGQNLDGQPIFDESLDRSGPLPARINETGIWLRLASTGAFLIGVVVGRRRRPGRRSGAHARRRRSASASPPTTATARRRRSTSSGSRPKDVQEPCQTGATPEAGYRMLFDGTATSLAHVADGRPRRLRAAAGLLDPVLRRPRPALSPGQLRVLLAQARLEDGRRRQRRRVRRLQEPRHRSVQRRQRRPRDPDRRHRRPVAHDRRGLQLPGRGGGRA